MGKNDASRAGSRESVKSDRVGSGDDELCIVLLANSWS